MYKKLCPDDRLATGHIICIRSGVFIVPTTISPLYLFLELLVLRILLLRLEAGNLSLAGGRCSISLIEGIAIVDHHVERTRHHVAEFEVVGEEHFHTGPNGIFETHCAFGHLHVSVGFVEGSINVCTVFFRHLEDLGEEKVEEVLILIVAEVDEVEGFVLELETEISLFGAEALFLEVFFEFVAKCHILLLF